MTEKEVFADYLKDERFRRLVNQILLVETEVVYRRKPREMLYIRRKPAKRGSPQSKQVFKYAAKLSTGERMRRGDPLPPGAMKVKQIVSGMKIVPEKPGPQHLAFARDLTRVGYHPLSPLLTPLLDKKVEKAVETLKRLYPELRLRARERV